MRAALLENMDPHEVAAATVALDADDAADILQDLPEPFADAVLRSMDDLNRARIASALSYPEDTAGGLMNVDVVTVRADVEVEVVLRYLRRYGAIPDKTDSLMVVDRENIYLGILSLAALVSSPGDVDVGDIMHVGTDPILASTDTATVALQFEQRDLLSAPVVDESGKLLGRITVDDVVDVIREQSAHSFMSAAGLNETEDIFAPVLLSSRRRATWLGINLATAFLAAWVIGRFEATLEELVALAILMPVVASMGGIAGSQTPHHRHPRARAWPFGLGERARPTVSRTHDRSTEWRVVGDRRGGGRWFWFADVGLGVIIGVAIIFNLLIAAFAGAVIPLFLRRINIDPALAGGVVLTTVTDVVGFVAFLGLATIFLL